MTTFIKTRAPAGYICRHGPGELARRRAATLLAQLGTCEAAPASPTATGPSLSRTCSAAWSSSSGTWPTRRG